MKLQLVFRPIYSISTEMQAEIKHLDRLANRDTEPIEGTRRLNGQAQPRDGCHNIGRVADLVRFSVLPAMNCLRICNIRFYKKRVK